MRSNEQVMTAASIRRLSPDQSQRLYWASQEILERTGIRVFHQEALDLLAKVGVKVVDGNRVRIPSSLVEWARRTAPKRVTLYDRHGNRVMPVEGYRTFFGPGSDTLNIIDHRDGRRRKPVLQDVVDAMTVADALERVDFVMSMFLPTDVPQDAADRYQMEVMLNTTTKPIMVVTPDFDGCVDSMKMAEIVAGGAEALQRRPNVACYVNVATGLRHNQEALEKLLFLSGKGLPFTYCPSTQGGASAPVTVAGAIAVAQAGALAGLVLSQLKREGAPFIMPGWGGNMLDMRTTIQPYVDPEKRVAVPDLVHFLGLPMFGLGGCSDSKVVDEQAGIEAALTLMTEALAGSNIVHDLGYLESGLTGSLAQLVICDEILDWLGHFVPSLVIDDETLALDLIDEVGPDGEFLSTEHTLNHYKDRWYPSLLDRDNFAGWHAKGGKTLGERAAERVSQILARHQPEGLPVDVARRVHEVVEQAASGH
jgi:trimethylamine---corrinoid protein Co-methyltransferase